MSLQIKSFSVELWKIGWGSSAYTQDLGSNLSSVSYSVNKLGEVSLLIEPENVLTYTTCLILVL